MLIAVGVGNNLKIYHTPGFRDVIFYRIAFKTCSIRLFVACVDSIILLWKLRCRTGIFLGIKSIIVVKSSDYFICCDTAVFLGLVVKIRILFITEYENMAVFHYIGTVYAFSVGICQINSQIVFIRKLFYVILHFIGINVCQKFIRRALKFTFLNSLIEAVQMGNLKIPYQKKQESRKPDKVYKYAPFYTHFLMLQNDIPLLSG